MKRHRKQRKPFAHLEWSGKRETECPPADLCLHAHVSPEGRIRSDEPLSSRLILGDNLAVMSALMDQYGGRVDLIYADPPFLSGKGYSARIGRGEDSRRPSEWRTIAGYDDTWQDGARYLDMLYPRLCAMHELLAPTGTFYLHLDWHASAYARVLLDEIFGPQQLLNEIIWVYHGPSPIRSAFKRKHDTILVYTKSKKYTFNPDAVRVPYNPNTVQTFASSEKAGFGKQPELEKGKVPEDWWYFPVVARLHSERTGYPTQKPESLIERIILASSNPHDLVADFFCGSGTTAVVASRLDRRWMACDNSPLAIHTTYRRLLLHEARRPFELWYENGDSQPPGLSIEFEAIASGQTVVLELKDVQGAGHAIGAFPENIVLWEADWHYERGAFHSQTQAIRGWREEEVPLTLNHTYPRGGEYQIAVRALDAHGREGMAAIRIRLLDGPH